MNRIDSDLSEAPRSRNSLDIFTLKKLVLARNKKPVRAIYR